MKYLFINSVYGVRSTGKIIQMQCRRLQEQGHICAVAYGRATAEDPSVQQIRIGTAVDSAAHGLLSRVLDLHGFGSRLATERFLKEVEAYQPDVIWMHNLHGYYINISVLFRWLKQHPEIQKYWTLHDCWAFTGHCANFLMAGCEKWRTGCHDCPQKGTYPQTIGPDRSRGNFKTKQAVFSGVENLTLVTPSEWLAGLTRESFLREYPVKVIPNQIDTSVFHPVESNLRETLGLGGTFVVLGIAIGLDESKGFSDFCRLRERLDDSFSILLVGLTPRQIESLPKGIRGLERTKDQQELVKLYTMSDVFVNPTHQDNYPTVNLEARACGIPVVTYDVGGSPESAGGAHVVPEGDIEALAAELEAIRAHRTQ